MHRDFRVIVPPQNFCALKAHGAIAECRSFSAAGDDAYVLCHADEFTAGSRSRSRRGFRRNDRVFHVEHLWKPPLDSCLFFGRTEPSGSFYSVLRQRHVGGAARLLLFPQDAAVTRVHHIDIGQDKFLVGKFGRIRLRPDHSRQAEKRNYRSLHTPNSANQ